MKIFKIKYLLFFPLLIIIKPSLAQKEQGIVWHNPAKQSFRVVHNQIWSGKDISSFYDRLPAKAKKNIRKEVWDLSKNSAGLKLIFNTNAKEIIVRYTTQSKKYAMSHFPATGVSGLDLFSENTDGSWAWANGKFQFKDTITYKYTNLSLGKLKNKNESSFHLYLPLYNSVEWLEIGVPAGSTFQFIPVSNEKPVIVYGTSIAQGGCASRPGMAWTNILNRELDSPVINLGFSGNGRLEKELIDLIVEKDAKMFIIDCLPNIVNEPENIKSKMIYATNTIRAKYPNTPIVFADNSAYLENRMDSVRTSSLIRANNISFNTFKELKAKGIKNLFYLTQKDIGLNMNDSVDGNHPTDIGMLKHAKVYKRLINKTVKH